MVALMLGWRRTCMEEGKKLNDGTNDTACAEVRNIYWKLFSSLMEPRGSERRELLLLFPDSLLKKKSCQISDQLHGRQGWLLECPQWNEAALAASLLACGKWPATPEIPSGCLLERALLPAWGLAGCHHAHPVKFLSLYTCQWPTCPANLPVLFVGLLSHGWNNWRIYGEALLKYVQGLLFQEAGRSSPEGMCWLLPAISLKSLLVDTDVKPSRGKAT